MYGLIGYPLGHSFSEKYFKDKFHKEGIDNSYHLFPIKEIRLLPELIGSHPDLMGLNVTIPYKRDVFAFLDSVSQDASAIGAVNVVRIERDNEGAVKGMKGFNSDWIGFMESLKPLLRNDIKNALVLGSGGASKAVVYALGKLGIRATVVSRSAGDGKISYDSLDWEIMADNLLIVNTTPLGMWPKIESSPEIPYEFITPDHVCYDLVYNPEITEFMKLSSEKGATVKNGLEMLHRQAEVSWKIWNE